MDIFKLTKSKTREKILQLFFFNDDKKYYLRELERVLNISVGNIRRELLALESSGIFKREKQGSQIYYFLNKDFPFFKELKSIIFKTIGIAGLLTQELKKIKNINQAFIFGSFAKNQEDSLSDIDLMIIGDIDEDLLIFEISKLEKIIKREINYHLFDEKQWQKESKKNSFLKTVLKEPQIKII